MRVVIKVGTSLIAPGGLIDANLLRAMVDQFDLSRNEYLIVTSGAIAAGNFYTNKAKSVSKAVSFCSAPRQTWSTATRFR